MSTKLRQVLPYAVTLAVSVWLYWIAGRIEADTGGRIGPSAWPKAVIAFMVLLCVYEIGKRLLFDAADSARGIVEMGTEEQPAPKANGMLLAGIGLIALYVVLVPFSGFFFSTALFLWAFPLVGGMRRPGLTAVVSLTGTLVLALVFLKVAYISLPMGVGPFRDLSIGLMRLIGVS